MKDAGGGVKSDFGRDVQVEKARVCRWTERNRCGTRYDEADYAGPHVHPGGKGSWSDQED